MRVAKECVRALPYAAVGLQGWETAGSSVELVVACSLVSRRGTDGGQHGNHFGKTPANGHHFHNPRHIILYKIDKVHGTILVIFQFRNKMLQIREAWTRSDGNTCVPPVQTLFTTWCTALLRLTKSVYIVESTTVDEPNISQVDSEEFEGLLANAPPRFWHVEKAGRDLQEKRSDMKRRWKPHGPLKRTIILRSSRVWPFIAKAFVADSTLANRTVA